MHKKTTISILEGSPLYRSLLSRMISSIDGYALDKVFRDPKSAQVLITAPSDIVIIDLEAGEPGDIFSFFRKLIDVGAVSVIACSQQEDDLLMRQAFRSGASGYIVKNSSYEEFRANLMLALSGGMPLSRSVVRRLVEVVRRDSSRPVLSGISEPIALTCQLIEEVLASPFSLKHENLSDFLSRRVGISYHHLSIQFKKEMSVNLSQYMILKKIERVKDMIREDHHSLTQIANMMDYSSVAHLSTQFRKITGLTPSDYRRSIFQVG